MRRKLFFILFGLTSFSQAFSQFAPIGSIPTIYNPGFAGEAGVPRIATNSILAAHSNTRSTTYMNCISYDNFFKKIRSGVSITAGQRAEYSKDESQAITPRFEKYIATIGISPKFSFRGKYTIAPFVDFSLTSVDKLLNYFTYDSPVREYNFQHKAFLSRTGFLINSAKAYVGLTVTVLESKFDEKKPVDDPVRSSLEQNVDAIFQAGYTFQRSPDSDHSFTPQIAIRWDKNARRRIGLHDVSLIWRYKKFIYGMSVPGIAMGYQNDRIRFLVSQWFFTPHNILVGVGVRYKLKSNNTSTIPFSRATPIQKFKIATDQTCHL